MSRPGVSVVMPFAGDSGAAFAAVRALLALDAGPQDELILADNCGCVAAVPGVTVVRADCERSPAHARNRGAERARCDWILFLDADCRAPAGLLDAYFAEPVAPDVGALAGEVLAGEVLAGPVAGGGPAVGIGAGGADPRAGGPSRGTLVQRYGAARSFLSQEAHLAHPYRPRAVAANLLVRRTCFEQVGGFFEGLRAAEDTDFSWRLQAAGWRLELRREARVEHRYRATLGELRRQWRGYAAGRAWLARRHAGFVPEPAVARALRRILRRGSRRTRQDGLGSDSGAEAPPPGRAPVLPTGPLERAAFLALDATLGIEELVGLKLSNRPARSGSSPTAARRRARSRAVRLREPVRTVLVADRFPGCVSPLAPSVLGLEGVRVEAVARPESMVAAQTRGLCVSYREDDAAAARALGLAALVACHPGRCAVDLVRRRQAPTLAALAPAALRLERDRGACVSALCRETDEATARRLAALIWRRLAPWPS